MVRLSRLDQLRAELKEVSAQQQDLASRADDLRGEIIPLAEADHRKRVRGALGAYVTASFIGKDTPSYGDHVTIVECRTKYVLVDAGKQGKWRLSYKHLSLDPPTGTALRLGRALSSLNEGSE